MLKNYNYQLKTIKSDIIHDLSKKFPELIKRSKTPAEKRRRQDIETVNELNNEPPEKRSRQCESAAERKSASSSRQDGNIDNLKCQHCENGILHICSQDDIEIIETLNLFNNETDDNEEYYDTVLDTFYEKQIMEME